MKVDVSLATGNERAQRELSRVVASAHEAALSVTAKRIETIEDRELAARLGCDAVQGDQFSVALAADALIATAGPIAQLNRLTEAHQSEGSVVLHRSAA
ncbi:MAG: hypothetical protein U0360_01295 [Dehalococcoidia bacterium]